MIIGRIPSRRDGFQTNMMADVCNLPLRWLRQEAHKFHANLEYLVKKPCVKEKTDGGRVGDRVREKMRRNEC